MAKLMKLFRRKAGRVPTDLEVLNEIYKRYYQPFLESMGTSDDAKIYIPIDIESIAHALEADRNIILGRLYYHLSQKYSYSYVTETGRKQVIFFALDEIPGKRHCIQFPLMVSVLAALRDEYSKFAITTWISIIALLVAIASFAISLSG